MHILHLGKVTLENIHNLYPGQIILFYKYVNFKKPRPNFFFLQNMHNCTPRSYYLKKMHFSI